VGGDIAVIVAVCDQEHVRREATDGPVPVCTRVTSSNGPKLRFLMPIIAGRSFREAGQPRKCHLLTGATTFSTVAHGLMGHDRGMKTAAPNSEADAPCGAIFRPGWTLCETQRRIRCTPSQWRITVRVRRGFTLTLPLQHCLGLHKGLFQRELPADSSHRRGSVAERGRDTRRGLFVVIARR
jgi:hypothetical protein